MSGRRGRWAGLMLLLGMAACVPIGWQHSGGEETLPRAQHQIVPPEVVDMESRQKLYSPTRTFTSRRIAFAVPAGWHWIVRGQQDLIATRDGVFLQKIFIERIHGDQVTQDTRGVVPPGTVENQKKRFAARMPPADLADVLLESRRDDPSVTDLKVREVTIRTINGRQAFRAEFDFRLKNSVLNPSMTMTVSDFQWKDLELNPSPLYRTIYCGFMVDDWFYGISYTAALRHYFEKDVAAFQAFLDSVRVLDE